MDKEREYYISVKYSDGAGMVIDAKGSKDDFVLCLATAIHLVATDLLGVEDEVLIREIEEEVKTSEFGDMLSFSAEI